MSSSKEYNKRYREKNRDLLRQKDRERYANLTDEQKKQRLEWSKKSYVKNKNKVLINHRHRHLEKTYNLTSKQYLEMMIEQQNRCAICENYETRILKSGDVKPLSVDHNHSTGEVRQLLCNDCNAMLGYARENITTLQNAIFYLQEHNDASGL